MATDLLDLPIARLDGTATTLGELTGGKLALLVNVASKCGLTPQYAGLEQLQETYGERGFTVVGLPCNQFMGQEPGSMEQILEFCSTTYGVSFPVNGKVKVNGRNAHELYKSLKQTTDAGGKAGRVEWNFEKFLVGKDGSVQRFRPKQKPDAPEIVMAIEDALVAAGR